MSTTDEYTKFFGDPISKYDYRWNGSSSSPSYRSHENIVSPKLALFHIYDKFLSRDYGAFRNQITDMVTAVDPTFFNSIQIIRYSEYSTAPKRFLQTMLNLHTFFSIKLDTYLTSYQNHALLECGTIDHSTKLLFSKFEDGVRCVHVNTGFGLDATVDKVMSDGVQCYNLFTEVAYFSYDDVTRFCNSLKPFVFNSVVATKEFFKLYELHRKEVYENCMYGQPYGFFAPFKGIGTDYYENQYRKLFSSDNNFFDNLRQLLSTFRHHITQFQVGDQALFLQKWKENSVETASENEAAYFKKAAENIVLAVEDSVVYMKPQEAGTCTYMSLIASLVALCTLPQPTPTPQFSQIEASVYDADTFLLLYNKISKGGYKALSEYDYSSSSSGFTNTPVLLQQLIEDNILIASDNGYYIQQHQENTVHTGNALLNTSALNPISSTLLADILKKIRNPSTNSDRYIINQIDSEINTFYRQRFHEFSYFNLIALRLLFFIHKNKQFLQYFESASFVNNWQLLVSFELTEDENTLMSSLGNLKSSSTGPMATLWNFKGNYTALHSHNEEKIQNYETCLITFINNQILQSKQKLKDVTDAKNFNMPVTVSYISTFLVPYFCKLTLQNAGLHSKDGVRDHVKLFLLSSGMFSVTDRTRIAALLLQRVAEVWTFADFAYKNDYELFYLVNYIHKDVRISFPKGTVLVFSESFLAQDTTHPSFKEIDVSTPKEAENILTVVKQHIVDGVINSETFSVTYIDTQTAIKNAMLRLVGITFEYNVAGNTWVSCTSQVIERQSKSYIVKYLNETGKFFTCTHNSVNYLLCVLPRNSYKNQDMLSEDLLFEFQVDAAAAAAAYTTDLSKLRINGQNVTCVFPVSLPTSTVLNTYPFLCTMPRACFKFISINENTNSVRVFLVQHNNIEIGMFANSVFPEDTYKDKNFLLELQIKQNFLLPILSAQQLNCLKEMVENSKGCMAPTVNNPIDKSMSPDKLADLNQRSKCPQLEPLSVFGDIKTLLGWSADTTCAREIPDSKLHEVLEKLDKSVADVKVQRRTSCENITFNNSNMFTIFTENEMHLFQLLQSNTRISTLLRIKQLFQKWSEVNCYELLELKELLLNYEQCSISKIDSAFQIALGLLIRKEQWEKYYEILESFETKTCKVYQFMMAKGKSSVITPMLLHYFTYNSPLSTLHIVIPSHLKKEVETTMLEYHRLLNIPVNILTDAEFKLAFLRHRNAGAPPKQENEQDKAVFNEKSIVLYDEIDDMYDATKSTFNVVRQEVNLNAALLQNIFKAATNILMEKTEFATIDTITDYTHGQLNEIVTNQSFKKNVHYGMSNNVENRVCIPYEKRLDSPMEGSQFASPLYTLAFTVRYFYDKTSASFVLYKPDVTKICSWDDEEGNTLIIALMNEWRAEYDARKSFETLLLGTFADTAVTKQVSVQIMATYFQKLVRRLSVSSETYNCSFVDVMNLDARSCLWAVGYSGTVLMDLNITQMHQRFQSDIVPDPDEAAGVAKALRDAKIVTIKNADTVWDLVRTDKFTAVIDACALFEHFNNDEVAAQLYKASGKKEIVYVRRDDTKMSYGPNGPYPYVDKFRAVDSVVYFYSQRHIIGVDFKQQPAYVKGLLLVGPQTTRTQAAQAMYRLRKLNKGHIITVGACFGLAISESEDIVLQTLQQTEDSEQFNKNIYLKIQYIKFLTRCQQEAAENAYKEIPNTDINLTSPPKVLAHTVLQNLAGVLRLTDGNAITRNAGTRPIFDQLTDTKALPETIAALFNTNSSVETAIVTNTETSTSTSTSTSTKVNAAQFEAIRTNEDQIQYIYTIWDWTTNSADIPNVCSVKNGENTIFFSVNLEILCVLHPRTYFLVQIEQRKFLLEPMECLPLYFCCGKPLYSMSGTIINNGQPFLTRTFANTTVKPNKLLHIKCQCKGREFSLWELFRLSPPRRTQLNADGVLSSTFEPASGVAVNEATFSIIAHLFRLYVTSKDLEITESNVDSYILACSKDIFNLTSSQSRLIPKPTSRYRFQSIPFTHSCKGLLNLYDWSIIYANISEQVFQASGGGKNGKYGGDNSVNTDYGVIVERNTLQQRYILQNLVQLADALAIPSSSRPVATFSELPDLDTSLKLLNDEVQKWLQLLKKNNL